MRPRLRNCSAMAAASAILVATVCAAGQSTPRRVRRIHITAGPIEESLRPDDEIVELAPLGESANLQVSPRELFEHALRQGDSSVVRVDVTGVSGVLADEGSFVRTKFVGSIVEVLKRGKATGARSAITVGRPVEFSIMGGEVAIGGVVVRSSHLVRYPYPAQYLVVLDYLNFENGWVLSLSPPLRVQGDELAPVAPQGSLLTGLRLSDMRDIIKKVR